MHQWLHVCVHVYMHLSMRAYDVCMYLQCTNTRTHACAHTSARVCTHASTYTCKNACASMHTGRTHAQTHARTLARSHMYACTPHSTPSLPSARARTCAWRCACMHRRASCSLTAGYVMPGTSSLPSLLRAISHSERKTRKARSSRTSLSTLTSHLCRCVSPCTIAGRRAGSSMRSCHRRQPSI